MKRITGFILIVTLLTLGACKQNDEKSFGYGNFEATEIMISSQAKGEILWFKPGEGDFVKKGELVGQIDTTDLYLTKKQVLSQKQVTATQLETINASISVQNQQLKNSLKNRERIHSLFEKNAATQKQVDDIDGAVALLKKQIEAVKVKKKTVTAQLEAIARQIDQINENIRKCSIVNPVDGTILVKYIEAGELAMPGKPLYKTADLTVMKLKAYVSGAQLSEIKIGQKVKVLYDVSATENKTVEGKITWISPTAEFTPKTIQTKEERVNLVYAVKIEVKNDGAIKIGMPGEFNLN